MKLDHTDMSTIQSLTTFDFSQVPGKAHQNSKFNAACTELTNKIRAVGFTLQKVADTENLDQKQVKELGNVIKELSRCCKKFQAAAGQVGGVVQYSKVLSKKLGEIDVVVGHIPDISSHPTLLQRHTELAKFRESVSSGTQSSEKLTFLKKYIQEKEKWSPVLQRLVGWIKGMGWINNSKVLEQLKGEIDSVKENISQVVTKLNDPKRTGKLEKYERQLSEARTTLKNIRDTIQTMNIKSSETENKQKLLEWVEWSEHGLTVLGRDLDEKKKLLSFEEKCNQFAQQAASVTGTSPADLKKLTEYKSQAESIKTQLKFFHVAKDSSQINFKNEVLEKFDKEIANVQTTLLSPVKPMLDNALELEKRCTGSEAVGVKTFDNYRTLANEARKLLKDIDAAYPAQHGISASSGKALREAREKAMAVFLESISKELALRAEAIEQNKQDANVSWKEKIDFLEAQIKDITNLGEPWELKKFAPKIGSTLDSLLKLKHEAQEEVEKLKKASRMIANLHVDLEANHLLERLEGFKGKDLTSREEKWRRADALGEISKFKSVGSSIKNSFPQGKERQILEATYNQHIANLDKAVKELRSDH